MRLLDVDGFDESAMRSTDLMIGVSLAGMVEGIQKQLGEETPQDLVDQLRTTIHDFTISTMRARLPEMKRKTAELYAREFTTPELMRLRELHSDPVAVKARERAKEMQPQLMMIGVSTMREAQPQLDAKLKQIVVDYLKAHGKALPEGSSS
jgi:hypothetical protein